MNKRRVKYSTVTLKKSVKNLKTNWRSDNFYTEPKLVPQNHSKSVLIKNSKMDFKSGVTKGDFQLLLSNSF